MVLRRPAAASASVAKATFDASQYTRFVKSFDSREECLQDLGCRKFCKSHSARAVKKDGSVTHLRCRLRSSTPPCKWAAIIKEAADQSAQLLQLPQQYQEHDQNSASKGKQGFDFLAERKILEPLLASSATARPQRALRQARLEKQGAVNKNTAKTGAEA